MVKDIVDANENVKSNNKEMEILHKHFPQCFNSNSEFDIDKFKELISDKANIINEGYSLDFLGKSYAKLLASIDTTTVIKPDIEHNNKPENKDSKNIYISGDNLDALKHLLKSYHGSVKCIYIDPPYNTGSDGFVYNDKFNFTADDLEVRLNIDYEQAVKILDMTSRGSASHSAWLTFMAPRLQIARDLLTNDGVIFISIDDNEQANLKLLCDNIFGEENFIACIPRITKRGGKSSDAICLNHDYLLIYSYCDKPYLIPQNHNDKGFKYKDEFFNDRGYYKLNQTLDYDSLQYSKGLDYPIYLDGDIFYPGSSEESYIQRQNGIHDRADWAWRWSKEKFEFGLKNGFIVIKNGKNGKRLYTKTYQNASIEDSGDGYYIDYGDRTKGLSTLELTENEYSNDNATKDIDKTIGKKVFDHSKPIALMDLILQICTTENDYVLDFFSGSSTMAEGVLWHNANYDKKLKFIMVQLDEKTKNNTSASKNGYKTIDAIGMDRIKKAGLLVKKDSNADIDYGFKHYTLEEQTEQTLDKLERFDKNVTFTDDNILSLFGRETVLETWMVKDGYGFGADVKPVKLDEYTAYLMDNHLYLVDTDFDKDDMVALIDKYNGETEFNPENIVVFGYSFTFAQLDMLQHNLITLNDGIKNKKVNVDVRY